MISSEDDLRMWRRRRAIAATIMLCGLIALVATLGRMAELESFVVPPHREAHRAPLKLYLTLEQPAHASRRWRGSRWSIHNLRCTAHGLEVTIKTMDRETPVLLQEFLLTLPEGPHPAYLALPLDNPQAAIVRLRLPDRAAATTYRLLRGHLVLERHGRFGMLEALLTNESGLRLFVDAQWSCEDAHQGYIPH